MKKVIALVVLGCFLLSCKKKSAIQEDLVILAMTTGQWKITSFVEGGSAGTIGWTTTQFLPALNYHKSLSQTKTDISPSVPWAAGYSADSIQAR